MGRVIDHADTTGSAARSGSIARARDDHAVTLVAAVILVGDIHIVGDQIDALHVIKDSTAPADAAFLLGADPIEEFVKV